MGSLIKSEVMASEQILALEQAERKLFAAKSRCKQEISAWLENVSFQLTENGKELIQDVEMTVNQLVMKMRENGTVNSAEMIDDMDIKFVPRILQKSELGFLCHGNILPSSLCLELLTKLPDIFVNATITFSVEANGLIYQFMKNNIDFSVLGETAVSLPCREVSGFGGGNSLQFTFSIPSPGHFTVSARLYNQHITGSPVVIPVFVSAIADLAQIGLAPLDYNTDQVEAVGTEAGVSPDTGTRPDRLMFNTCLSDPKMIVMRQPVGPGSLPGEGFARPKILSPVGGKVDTKTQEIDAQPQHRFTVGDLCFAKWDQDNVWYNGRIDKDCGVRGVEVTFVDYDNSDFVQRKNIVWSREDIPESAVVDFGQVEEKMFAVGDFGVAQWEEDGFWYNAEVVGLEREGYSARFTDYGNVGFVELSGIFNKAAEIPEGESLDVHVSMLMEPGEQVKVEEDFVLVQKELYLGNLGTKWAIGNDCLARWEEDGRWYNAIVDTVFDSSTPVQYLVTFIDHGNSEIVTEDDLAANVEGIPVDQLDMLDENVLESSQVVKDETLVIIQTEVNQTNRKPLVRTNFDCPPIPVPKCDKLAKGVDVVAKRKDDETWHRGVIHEVVAPGSLYIVKFEDIGQFGGVSPENIVIDEEDIPKGENLGHDLVRFEVKKEMIADSDIKGSKVGDICIARWSNDNVWYNARVVSVGVGRSYVKFIDYGNEDNVVEDDIVKSAMEIPDDSFVDENVDQNLEEAIPKVLSEIVVPQYYEETPAPTKSLNKIAPKVPRPLKPESFDQARILAGAISAAAASCKVASCKVAAESPRNEISRTGVEPVSKIPPSLQCCLCQNICRKGMRLACDNSPVCWGCAVKEITRGHVCWQCGEKNITSDNHLVKDQVLRSFVEQLISTGKLDPAHEQALRNGLMLPENTVEVKTEPISSDQAPYAIAPPHIESSSTLPSRWQAVFPGDACVAKCSEDGIWYNGLVSEVYGDGSALVYFIDYGNSERVKRVHVVREPEDLPSGAKVDLNVQKLTPRKIAPSSQILRSSTTSDKLNFLSLAALGADGFVTLAAKQTLTIKDLKGPVGVTVLADGTLAVVCRGANCVSRYNKEGTFLGIIKPGREFVKPSDILTLTSGHLVVRDERGLQLFGEDLVFDKFLAEEAIDRCFGLAEDDDGRIITINCNTMEGDKAKITMRGMTDIFFIERISSKVVKRVEMVELIEEAVKELHSLEAEMSLCRFLTYYNQTLYVVDMGLDCIFVLNNEETESELFGRRGNQGGEFRDPAGMVVDEIGTMMVVDSRNHRLQLIDRNLNFVGLVKVDIPLARPSGIFLDRVNRDIVVSNYLGKSVVKYRMEEL